MDSIYVCKYGLWHDKPCVNNEPSSNNGWIYTAFAQCLNLINNPTHYSLLSISYYMSLIKDDSVYWISRFPGKKLPPISRDEIIGMVILKVLPYEKIKSYNFNMVKTENLTKSFHKMVVAVLSLRKKHRNYAWQSEILDAYPIVFRLFGHDRYFIKKAYQVSPTILETLQFYLYFLSVISKKEPGELNILWSQLKYLESKILVKFIDIKKSINSYFGSEHHFSKVINSGT